MHWHKPAGPEQDRVTGDAKLCLARGQGRAQVLTGAASEAHPPGSSDVILAAAVGGLGAVQGNRRRHWGQGGACREGQGFRAFPEPGWSTLPPRPLPSARPLMLQLPLGLGT